MNNKFWIGVSVITVLSISVTFYAPISEAYKGVAALPSVGALFVALFQLVRDNAAYQRSIEIQKKQQLFSLGATSHMANTVFDKHVEFCEKYLEEVHQLVITLTKEGPTKIALVHAAKLYDLRIEFTAWVTPEIEERLMPFEEAVRAIGAKANLVSALSKGEKREEVRSKALTEMYDTFSNIMGFDGSEIKDEASTIKEVKNRVREILGVSDLVSIREYLVKEAGSVASNS